MRSAAPDDVANLPTGVRSLVLTLCSVADRLDELTADQQVGMVEPALAEALVDPTTRELYRDRTVSYLVWSRPGSMTVHASVHPPGHVTPPHDHGAAWAVYGVVAGPTMFRRFARGVDREPGVADLGPADERRLEPGETEVVRPGEVHAVTNPGDDWSWNLVVRARSLQEIERSVFDLATGAYRTG